MADTDFNGTSQASPTNDVTGAARRARVAGSTFTVFTWQGQPITFAQQIQIQSATAVADVVPIHPLDSPYPVDLITPMALTMGQMTLQLYELYGAYVWQQLAGLNGDAGVGGVPVDLANIFQAVANSPNPIHIVRVIRPPRIRGANMAPYTEEFHNCVVSSLDDGETITIGSMEVIKTLTVNYTHLTRGGNNTLLTKSNLGVAPQGTTFG